MSTGDVPVETLRWEVDALKHWRREIDTKVRLVIDKAMNVLHMRSERGPPDYNIRRDERRALVSVLRDLLKEIRSRPPPSMNNGDDSTGIKKWVAGVGAVLATAFIIAGWTVSNQVASQSVQIEYLIAQIRELNARVTRIEQQQNERR